MTQTYDRYKRKRIVEVIDSDGDSLFYPQEKFLFWWRYIYNGYKGKVRFNQFDDCKDFLLYEREVKKRIVYV